MSLFEPFRALGYVTSGVPFALQRRGTETFITVSVGRAWQIYDVAKLRLVLVGPELPGTIRALACFRDFTFAACGKDVAVFSRAHQVAVLRGHEDAVQHLLVLGDSVLVSVGADSRMLLWPMLPWSAGQAAAAAEAGRAGGAGGAATWQEVQPLGSIDLGEDFTPTCIMHPDTYLNKVLLGSEQGRLQLWNVSSRALVHEFQGWGSPVRACVGSPALDTVAVGCQDGSIHVHNLRYDEPLMAFQQDRPVTALSFRADGQPWLASGDSSGEVLVWDLEKRRLRSAIHEAHGGPLGHLHFLANEPVLISSSEDNSIKMWIFDSLANSEARLLRFRTGHSAPPCCIQYYDTGRHILSAGHDKAFRVFSTIQDQRNRELSQGQLTKKAKARQLKVEEVKLPPVVALDSSEVRERDWANVVTCHEGHPSAYLWHLRNFAMGKSRLRPPGKKTQHSPANVCCISACGNFGVVGYRGGEVRMFNLQSALLRRSFRERGDLMAPAHGAPVTGVGTDACNRRLISTSLDGCIKLWDMRSGRLLKSLSLGSPIIAIKHNRLNELVAVACDDQVLRVIDARALRVVRRLPGHKDRVTALDMSSDGRWLVSASMDSTLRVWDVVHSTPLACMRLAVPVVGLSLSPSMDMLATIHSSRQGIYLWSNKAMYSGLDEADLVPALRQGQEQEQDMEAVPLPALVGPGEEEDEAHWLAGDGDRQGGANSLLSEERESREGGRDGERPAKRSRLSAQSGVQAAEGGDKGMGMGKGKQPERTIPGLVCLGLLPRTQWLNLVNLDIIRERNRPVEPPKKPEAAPFFLPTIPGLAGQPVFSTEPAAQDSAEPGAPGTAGRVRTLQGEAALHLDDSPLMAAVRNGSGTGDYSQATTMLAGMSPSAMDVELRGLEIVDLDSPREEEVANVQLFMDFLCDRLHAKTFFELFQAIVLRFLTIHGEAVSRIEALRTAAEKLHLAQSSSWERLDSLFSTLECVTNMLLGR